MYQSEWDTSGVVDKLVLDEKCRVEVFHVALSQAGSFALGHLLHSQVNVTSIHADFARVHVGIVGGLGPLEEDLVVGSGIVQLADRLRGEVLHIFN